MRAENTITTVSSFIIYAVEECFMDHTLVTRKQWSQRNNDQIEE